MSQYFKYAKDNRIEVAFITKDGYQNRGIGTWMLNALVRHARVNGIKAGFAEVLHHNRQMLRVFEKSGLQLELTREEGTYLVQFEIWRRPRRRRYVAATPRDVP